VDLFDGSVADLASQSAQLIRAAVWHGAQNGVHYCWVHLSQFIDRRIPRMSKTLPTGEEFVFSESRP